MSVMDDGGFAFPQHGWTKDPEVLKRMQNQGGMTLRDWFAGQALAGMVAAVDRSGSHALYAEESYKFADAMLKARGGAS